MVKLECKGFAVSLDRILLLVYYNDMDYSMEEDIIERFLENKALNFAFGK